MIKRFLPLCAATGLTLTLAACGGGGGGGDAKQSAAAAASASLSEAQRNYESAILFANGGFHHFQAKINYQTSATGALSVNAANSYFYTTDSSLAQSPAGQDKPQALAVSYTPLLAAYPAVPNPTPLRYLVNNVIVVGSLSAPPQVSYVNGKVLEQKFATDGKTVVLAQLGTSYQPVPLSGAISASPGEVFANSGLGVLTNTVNGVSAYNQQANWQAGAAYLKVARQTVGDTLQVQDCVSPLTTGDKVTPCPTAAATLESVFPVNFTEGGAHVTYQLADGQIGTVAGARAWVANKPLGASVSPAYRVIFEHEKSVKVGVLVKDGTPSRTATAGTSDGVDFYLFFNKAAVQSVKDALTF